MFNNRMLAVAAVLAMAVPALGAATPIVVPPSHEQLVEGHTVFTVIEIAQRTNTSETRFAAAVAVLVREYVAVKNAQRFPGVLWFNDQYLVNPVQSANEVNAFRYPCGGAVVAVNRGDPDPRMVIARATAATPYVEGDVPDPVDDTTGDVDQGQITAGSTFGDSSHDYSPSPPWEKPTGPQTYNNDYAWIGTQADGGGVNATTPSATAPSGSAWSDTTVGTLGSSADSAPGLLFALNATGLTPWDYRESYLITDPNDHSWVIDKYNFYTRDGTGGSDNLGNTIEKGFGDTPRLDGDGVRDADVDPTNDPAVSEHSPLLGTNIEGNLSTLYHYPVWVVNILGSPVFVPDNGQAIRVGSEFIGENCVPFKDLLEEISEPANGALCGIALEDQESFDTGNTGNDTDVTLNAYNGVPPWTDDPCMSYQEPSDNGFCYGGQAEAYPPAGCDREAKPLRLYNALLYFKLQDLRVFGAPRNHCTNTAGNAADPSTETPDGQPRVGGAGTSIGGTDCDPALSDDTNGCSDLSEPPAGYNAADEWYCPNPDGPNNGEDNNEGNSHPFHPDAPPHQEVEQCLPDFDVGQNPANHGGSTYIQAGDRATDAGWFGWTPCDYRHATRDIDIYFSGAGRPFPPLVRNFDVVDLEGSSAPFQDYHASYAGTPP